MITSLSIGRGGLGRFGNCCFTIAGTIGIAVKSGQPYSFPRWQTHDNAIFGNPVDDIEDHLLNPLPRIPEGIQFQEAGYWWGFKPVYLPTGNWTIDAHLQSERYFKHCLPLIRETFTFKDEPDQNDYVAIHYRAGDYIDDPNAQHPRCSGDYYLKAMNHFVMEINRHDRFMLFSDDPDDFFKRMDHRRNHYHITVAEKGNYIEHFKLMKRCKSFITANSSFSLMAAILGDHPEKKIIMPRNWFGSQMPLEFNTDDIYPEGAIII